MNKIAGFSMSLSLVAILFSPLKTSAQGEFPVETDNEEGFISIFDGKTLDGWAGDPVYWSAADGVMTGKVTPETLLKENSFIVWKGGKPRDFELKMDYRVSDKGNSGINYRSVMVGTGLGNKYAMKGYQLDIDGEGTWTGQNYEERGRQFLALRGEMTQKRTGEQPEITARIGDKNDLWNAIDKEGGWNEAHIIARGNVLIHIINGKVMSIVVDDDIDRIMEGMIGMQVHVGPSMTIEYKNIRLKDLK